MPDDEVPQEFIDDLTRPYLDENDEEIPNPDDADDEEQSPGWWKDYDDSDSDDPGDRDNDNH